MPRKMGRGSINPYREEPPLPSLLGTQDSEEAPPTQPIHLWGTVTGYPGIWWPPTLYYNMRSTGQTPELCLFSQHRRDVRALYGGLSMKHQEKQEKCGWALSKTQLHSRPFPCSPVSTGLCTAKT